MSNSWCLTELQTRVSKNEWQVHYTDTLLSSRVSGTWSTCQCKPGINLSIDTAGECTVAECMTTWSLGNFSCNFVNQHHSSRILPPAPHSSPSNQQQHSYLPLYRNITCFGYLDNSSSKQNISKIIFNKGAALTSFYLLPFSCVHAHTLAKVGI